MQTKSILGTTFLFLLAGAPIYARQEPDKDKPREDPKKQEEPRKGEQPKPAEKPKQEPDKRPEDRPKPAQPSERQTSPTPKLNAQQDRSQDQQRARQTEQHSDRNAGNDGNTNRPRQRSARRIPEPQYRASFGSEHHFHVRRDDNRRFQYGGYWFTYSEGWPSDWSDDDDVYIEDVDGEYYLLNARHPGVRILVIIGD